MKSKQLIGIAAALFIVGIALQSQPGSAAGTTDSVAVRVDLEYGEEINETCAACHGEFGEGMPDGEYPRLAGQHFSIPATAIPEIPQRGTPARRRSR